MTGVMHRAKHKARAQGSDWKDTIGRAGLAGRGVLYAVIAVLALQMALGSPDEEASSSGAFAWIAEQLLGKVLLIALTVALCCMALWRFLDAAVGDPVEGDEAMDRARFAVKGVVYASLALGALSVLMSGSSGSGSGESEQRATGVVLDWPMGQWIVGLAGLAVIGYAAYVFKRHTLDEHFRERLSTSSEPVVRFGKAGYAARSAVWAVVGVMLIQAAVNYDPEQAGGLSVALQELASTAWGPWLLGAVALGLLAFGAFCVAEARYRRAA